MYDFVDSFPPLFSKPINKCRRVFPAGLGLDSPSRDDVSCQHDSAVRSKRGGGGWLVDDGCPPDTPLPERRFIGAPRE